MKVLNVQIHPHFSIFSPVCSKEQRCLLLSDNMFNFIPEDSTAKVLILKQKTPKQTNKQTSQQKPPLLGHVVTEEFRIDLGKSSLFLSLQQETPKVTQGLKIRAS